MIHFTQQWRVLQVVLIVEYAMHTTKTILKLKKKTQIGSFAAPFYVHFKTMLPVGFTLRHHFLANFLLQLRPHVDKYHFVFSLSFCCIVVRIAQSWTALFRAFSSHRQPSAI